VVAEQVAFQACDPAIGMLAAMVDFSSGFKTNNLHDASPRVPG
jgi:hypothetical protein